MLPQLLIVALLATPASRPSPVAARVGKDLITAAEVLQRASAKRTSPNAALEELVREAVAASLAEAEGLATEPRVRERLAAERRRLAVALFLRREVDDRIKVSDADVVEELHARNDRVRLSLVIRATDAEARAALERLEAGSGIIAEAQLSSDPQVRARSGVFPTYTRGELPPPMRKAAFEAPLEKPAGPLHIKEGWAVFLVNERRVADPALLREDIVQIRRELEQRQRDELMQRLMRQLRGPAHGARPDPARAGRVLADIAVRRGFERHPDVAAAMRTVHRTELARAYAHWIGDQLAAPTSAEIQARYDERREDFWLEASRTCTVLDAKGEAEARALQSRLVAGERPEDLVAAFAVPGAPSHATGVVTFPESQIETMTAAHGDNHALAWTIRRGKPDEWSVVDSRTQWHVVRCAAPEPRRRRALQEVRSEIAEAIRFERTTARVNTQVEARRRVTSVQIYPAVVPASGTAERH